MTIYGFEGNYSWLSNFYGLGRGPSGPLTAEHLFQAAKTQDMNERNYVLSAPTPKEAKARGKGVTLRPDWSMYRIEAMEHVLRYKFEDPELRGKLVGTGDTELVEANWWNDTYWGVNHQTGQGHNMLGKLLMKLRDEFQQNAEAEHEHEYSTQQQEGRESV